MKTRVEASETVELVTFGCRLNAVEAEAMRHAAIAAGHANLVIVNTCAVTGEAVRQARQTIRRLVREKPGSRIVVTGCAAEIEPEPFAALEGVGALVGNGEKTLPKTWAALDFSAPAQKPQAGIMQARVQTPIEGADRLEGRTRGFVAVQNGCDHRCTFCVIPFGRGPSRSVPIDAVVGQVRRLVAGGHVEIVLTGVDLTAYGADLPDSPTLGALTRQVLKQVPDLRRLRLSSLDCIEADPALIAAIAGESRLMPHLHLSLQAGDDIVLKRMKRRHGRGDAIDFCAGIRRLRPDMVFGADMIVGFPTETEAMFQRSLDLVAECGVTHLHVFPFSARPGTPAARMPQVDGAIIRERAQRLRAAGDRALKTHLDRQTGRRLTILSERGGIGRAEDFTKVRLSEIGAGEFLDLSIVGHDGTALLAA